LTNVLKRGFLLHPLQHIRRRPMIRLALLEFLQRLAWLPWRIINAHGMPKIASKYQGIQKPKPGLFLRKLRDFICTMPKPVSGHPRSEEHTSELQSRFDLVCRLLLEKNKPSNEEIY